MPYDITDAKQDIQILDAKIEAILSILQEKGLIKKEEDTNAKK